MGAIELTHRMLREDDELVAMLAKNHHKRMEHLPAIYDASVPTDAPLPYIKMGYDLRPGALHWQQVDGTIMFDVYDDSQSSSVVDAIKSRVQYVLAFQHMLTDDNLVSYYLGDVDGSVEDEDPAVVRWSFDIRVKYWRTDLID